MAMKGYKNVVDNRMRHFGDTDLNAKIIRVNKRKAKNPPAKKQPLNNHAKKYPELLDTIVHEQYHAKHPKATEKTTKKQTRKLITKMVPKQKKKLYSKFAKRPITKSQRNKVYREYQKGRQIK